MSKNILLTVLVSILGRKKTPVMMAKEGTISHHMINEDEAPRLERSLWLRPLPPSLPPSTVVMMDFREPVERLEQGWSEPNCLLVLF